MNNWRKIFGLVKTAGANMLFNDLNRRMILGISSGDSHPKPIDSIEDEFPDMSNRYRELTNKKDVDVDLCTSFITTHTKGAKSYRHHVIDMSYDYDLIIEYFVLSGGEQLHESHPTAHTQLLTTMRYDGLEGNCIYAIMLIYENHPFVGEDTMGKIVKHELTHVLLELMEYGMCAPIWSDPVTDEKLIDSKEERSGFEEFLCDYIQWDSTIAPNEDPVDKFRDVMKTYLTWVASDLYEPYLEAVEQYYKDHVDDIGGNGEEKEDKN